MTLGVQNGRPDSIRTHVHLEDPPAGQAVLLARERVMENEGFSKMNHEDTCDEQRDAHLRSPDFLDAATHPTIGFVATDVQGEGDAWRVRGDLTIRGVTRPVTLEVAVDGEGDDPWGNHRVGLTATTTIDRTQWGLTWNAALETGGVLVGDSVWYPGDRGGLRNDVLRLVASSSARR